MLLFCASHIENYLIIIRSENGTCQKNHAYSVLALAKHMIFCHILYLYVITNNLARSSLLPMQLDCLIYTFSGSINAA